MQDFVYITQDCVELLQVSFLPLGLLRDVLWALFKVFYLALSLFELCPSL